MTTCCTIITTQRSCNHGNSIWPLNNTANICPTVRVPVAIIVEILRATIFTATYACICSEKIYNLGKYSNTFVLSFLRFVRMHFLDQIVTSEWLGIPVFTLPLLELVFLSPETRVDVFFVALSSAQMSKSQNLCFY